MGMYTEFILGCSLSKDTPKVCIDALNYVINGTEETPKPAKEVVEFIDKWNLIYLLWGGSYYFGVNKAHSKFWYDEIDHSWHISSRSNIKNYDNEIEKFISYIEDYVDTGSGEYEIYAYVLYEASIFPTIYTLHGTYKPDYKIID